MYKAFDGQQDRRNWRLLLLEALDGWLRLFPEVASKNKGRLRLGPLPTPSRGQCRLTISELNIAPYGALQAVDRTWLFGPMAVTVAPFRLKINTRGVRNISSC